MASSSSQDRAKLEFEAVSNEFAEICLNTFKYNMKLEGAEILRLNKDGLYLSNTILNIYNTILEENKYNICQSEIFKNRGNYCVIREKAYKTIVELFSSMPDCPPDIKNVSLIHKQVIPERPGQIIPERPRKVSSIKIVRRKWVLNPPSDIVDMPVYNSQDNFYFSDFIRKYTGVRFKPNQNGLQQTKYDLNRIIKACLGKNDLCVIKQSATEPFALRKMITYQTYSYHSFDQEYYLAGQSEEDIKYGHPKIVTESIPIFQALVRNFDILTEKFVFFPTHNLNDHTNDHKEFNLFPGYKAHCVVADPSVDLLTPEQLLLIQPYIDHIKYCYANGDNELFDYILSYIAYPLRNNKKTKKCLILSGKEGAGKNSLFELIGNFIYGRSLYVELDSMDKALQKHNNIVAHKLLVVINEAKSIDGSKVSRDMFEKFKDMVTNEYTTVEPKGIDAFDIENYVNYVITTNNDFVMPITSNDRRYIMVRVSDTHMGDVKYFNDFYKGFTQEVANILFTYLIGCQIKIVSIDNIPTTDIRLEAQELTKHQYEHFCNEIFVEHTYAIDFKSLIVDNDKIRVKAEIHDAVFLSTIHLFEEYLVWKKTHSITAKPYSKITLTKNFKIWVHEHAFAKHKRSHWANGKNNNGFVINLSTCPDIKLYAPIKNDEGQQIVSLKDFLINTYNVNYW